MSGMTGPYSTSSPMPPTEGSMSTWLGGHCPKGGHLIIASFADDGPERCSDLDVCRYKAASMAAELGEGFSLLDQTRETHTTPWNTRQAFFYGVFRRQ